MLVSCRAKMDILDPFLLLCMLVWGVDRWFPCIVLIPGDNEVVFFPLVFWWGGGVSPWDKAGPASWEG